MKIVQEHTSWISLKRGMGQVEGSRTTKNQIDTSGYFDRTLTCDRQTDRQTDTDTGNAVSSALAKRRAGKSLLVVTRSPAFCQLTRPSCCSFVHTIIHLSVETIYIVHILFACGVWGLARFRVKTVDWHSIYSQKNTLFYASLFYGCKSTDVWTVLLWYAAYVWLLGTASTRKCRQRKASCYVTCYGSWYAPALRP